MMHTLSDLLHYAGVTSHKLTLLSIRDYNACWGRTGRAIRPFPRYTVWYDTEDQNDRIVFTFEAVLNTNRTAPEKLADISIQISHHSDWDPVKRKLTVSHPERFLKVDGMAVGAAEKTKSLWKEITALTEGLKRHEKLSSYEVTFLAP
ncbi:MULTISPECIES: hypothetical protein [Morganellaceae]|uniref:Uncharacterized protein n=2 Tax=Morganellaceae TaxID=1903414 RepID=A0A9Q8V5X0_9GAMM|nr:hypothetical protein [Moellerella wisconsensis]UNH29072.1 hypothetical protein MNY64_16110 [Moellerella wisconsensis]UNH32657.1 hypothetical protein MNY72_16670 [Moellerella wisconsensis]WJW83425.1 hypothetical protein QU516_15790 [Moellerella wisconsensis]